jgi:hypothetical protein
LLVARVFNPCWTCKHGLKTRATNDPEQGLKRAVCDTAVPAVRAVFVAIASSIIDLLMFSSPLARAGRPCHDFGPLIALPQRILIHLPQRINHDIRGESSYGKLSPRVAHRPPPLRIG